MNTYQIASLAFFALLIVVLFMDYKERKMFNDYVRAKSKCGCKDHPATTQNPTDNAPAPDTIEPAMTNQLL